MRSHPIAWLITHDAYIDRRILFFADVLLENGYAVKLFPSAYTDLAGDGDPDYVVRPLDWSVVKLYGLPLEALMENERALLETVIKGQETYHADNDRYAPSIQHLHGIKKTVGYTLSTAGERSGYLASITRGQRCLVYDSRTRCVTVIADREVARLAREYERAIVDADLETVEDRGFSTYGDIAVAYTRGPRGEALAAHCKASDNGVWLFNNMPPELYRGTPIPCGGLREDELAGRSFDYMEFRKIIYDFSPILEQVRRSLAEEQPDLVYVADLPTLPIGVMLKKTLGCQLMVDCHEWWYKQVRLWESGMAAKISLCEKSEAELYPQCDLCVTVGQYLARDMEEAYQKRFDVIYSCMSFGLSLSRPCAEEGFWRERGVPEGCRVAIFQGGMTELRNLDNLARATRYLEEDCYLAVVGGGPYEDTFLRILEAEGNPDRVVMVGWVNQSDLLRFTVNADLGVLPYSAVDEYFSYSVPNKLMEYYEAALPMLYDVTMKEIAMVAGEDDVGVGADLSDSETFGRTMNELLHDPERLALMKFNYSGCKEKFNYDSQKQALEKILEAHGLL